MVANTVFISGHFNVIHAGHLRLFRFAKELGNRLIVAVESDEIAGDAAHLPQNLRLEGVESNSWVDEAILMTDSIQETLRRIRPDIVVKGKEHELSKNPELEELNKYGGRLVFSSGGMVFSSFDLIRQESNSHSVAGVRLPQDYLDRHSLDKRRLLDLLGKFKTLNICVIGDLIVDEYITCQALGMSQEDPTIVVSPIDSARFIGGAGIVAAHAAGMGANVKFLSVIGTDESGSYAADALKSCQVDCYFLQDESRPTTLKQRYRSDGKTLLRVSHLQQNAIPISLQEKIIRKFKSISSNLDLVVFSDFNYGCLPKSLIQKIVEVCGGKIYMIADSQSSSQIGDISRFQGMNLVAPTEREARLATRDAEDGLIVLAEKLRNILNCENVLLKLGSEGLIIHAGRSCQETWLTDRIEALNQAPKDVAGAGDSLLITTGMALSVGANIWAAALLGSVAAAIQVSRVGNVPLKVQELIREISR